MQERNYEVTIRQSGKIDELLGKGITNIRCTKDSEGKFTEFEERKLTYLQPFESIELLNWFYPIFI